MLLLLFLLCVLKLNFHIRVREAHSLALKQCVQGTHAVRFGPDAKSLLVGASDHNLRHFTL